MKTEVLENKKNQIIGYIDTDYKKRKTLRDKDHHIVAYYYPSINMTKDQYHNDIGEGDLLGSNLMKRLKEEMNRIERAREEFFKRSEILSEDY